MDNYGDNLCFHDSQNISCRSIHCVRNIKGRCSGLLRINISTTCNTYYRSSRSSVSFMDYLNNMDYVVIYFQNNSTRFVQDNYC